MALLPFIVCVLSRVQHPEWGPEPPVAPYGQANLPDQHVVIPLIFPVLAKCRWKDGYNDERGAFRHTGIDIRAPKMSPIVAPFGGVLGMKRMSFWIYGDSGWAMLGTHLNDDNFGRHDHAAGMDLMFAPNLTPGQHVYAGQFIGYVGESGDATAPHLHFEIYAPGPLPTAPRIRNPFPSLKAAQVISAPVVIPPRERPSRDEIRFDGCIRKVDPDHHRITLLLVDKELPNGAAYAITHVRYLRVRVPDSIVASINGWYTLSHRTPTRPLAVFLPNTPKPDDATVTRLALN